MVEVEGEEEWLAMMESSSEAEEGQLLLAVSKVLGLVSSVDH